jgi:hypothetical protein
MSVTHFHTDALAGQLHIRVCIFLEGTRNSLKCLEMSGYPNRAQNTYPLKIKIHTLRRNVRVSVCILVNRYLFSLNIAPTTLAPSLYDSDDDDEEQEDVDQTF